MTMISKFLQIQLRALARTKLKEGGGMTIGPIETAENMDTCVAIIDRYILYMQACVCVHNRLLQWLVSS